MHSPPSPSSILHLPPPYPPRPVHRDTRRLQALLPLSSSLALFRLPSHLALPLAHLAPSLPAPLVWLNDRWSLPDIVHALRSSGATHLLLPPTSLPPSFRPQLLQHIPQLTLLTIQRLPSADILISPPLPPTTTAIRPPASPTPAIFFTSGTTSLSKPVILHPHSLHVQSLSKIAHLSLRPSSVYLHLSPLFHLSGHSTSHAISLIRAAHVFPPSHLRPSRPADARALLALVREHRVSVLVLLPAVLILLLDAAPAASYPSVDVLLYGGGPLSHALRRQAQTLFPNARVVAAYGMTEAASSLTFFHHDNFPPNSPLHNSVGWPPKHVELRIDTSVVRGDARGVGEILTRGPHVMAGYGVVRRGVMHGWLRTGDLGYVDAGSGALFLKGRCKDMIKSGGENVFAGEVEEMLMRGDQVEEAAVVGIPHRVLGEAVAAVVVLMSNVTKPEGEVLSELMELCRECLSPFKRPKWIVRSRELPRTATGKIRKGVVKHMLRKQLMEATAKL